MIAVPPFPEEVVKAAERKELATRILVAMMSTVKGGARSQGMAAFSVGVADALLAELAK